MNLFLLDVAAGSEIVAVSLGVVVFMAGCVLLEAAVIKLLKTTTTFGNAFKISLIVNIVTMIIGFIAVPKLEDGALEGRPEITRLLIYFAATFILELFVLKLLLKTSAWAKLTLTCLLMNLASYGLLLAFVAIDF